MLDAAAEPVAIDDYLVLGVTPDTPKGLLGRVVDVNIDPDTGDQEVVTEPALLEDASPRETSSST